MFLKICVYGLMSTEFHLHACDIRLVRTSRMPDTAGNRYTHSAYTLKHKHVYMYCSWLLVSKIHTCTRYPGTRKCSTYGSFANSVTVNSLCFYCTVCETIAHCVMYFFFASSDCALSLVPMCVRKLLLLYRSLHVHVHACIISISQYRVHVHIPGLVHSAASCKRIRL